jgi:eukaryotic-like serine/threonine-protein kinase
MNSKVEEAIFGAALAARPEERAAYLDGACGQDAQLRRRVEALLRALEKAGDFMVEPVASLPDQTVRVSIPLTEKVGDKIGHYKLLQQIGEGGCGVVYMAEQEEPIRRRVALKVIKLGMDTKAVIARFEAERQALALMDHPNIARVLDAGATDTGRPYFVMELVRGIKITEYCDQNSLSTESRLSLFIQVCHAIQHAHQKGVIHRDIKPSNILVTVNDGVPVPKVIDFGIAKATGGQLLTDKTLFTAFEQFIGTPAYMSPEQAAMTSLDIDTRSDVYALGVLLYELLTGQTPFDARTLMLAGLEGMRRIIREQEPLHPSTRLCNLAEAEQTTVASHRQTEPPKLVHLVQGDLDWIVMKCLEKDRQWRYETANGLANDILRHLHGEPVVARPPSRLYRFQKLVRRNKLVFAAVGAVATALIIGLALSTWLFVREREARRVQSQLRQLAQQEKEKARTQAEKSQQVARFLKDMLEGVGPSVALGRDTKMLREIMDKTADRVGKELTRQPEVEAELRNIVAGVYNQLGLAKPAEEMARESLRVARAHLGEKHLAVAEALYRIGEALCDAEQYAESEKFYRDALALKRELLGDEHPEVAEVLIALGFALKREMRFADAENIARQAVAVGKKRPRENNPTLARALYLLGIVMEFRNNSPEAEALLREALALQRKCLGEDHPDTLDSLGSLAFTLRREGKLSEAEPLARQALEANIRIFGNKHGDVTGALNNLALVLANQGKLVEAETLYRERLEICRETVGEQHRTYTLLLENLAPVLQREHKLEEVASIYRKAAERGKDSAWNDFAWFLATCSDARFREGSLAVSLAEKAVAATSRTNALYLDTLGTAYAEAGQFSKAVAAQQEALALSTGEAERNDRAFRLRLWESHSPYREADSDILTGVGDFIARESLYRHHLEVLRTLTPADDSLLSGTLALLVSTLLVEQKITEAEPLARECLAIRERVGRDDWFTFHTRSQLAACLLGQKKYAEAERLLVSAYEGMREREAQIPSPGKVPLRESLQRLVRLYEETNRPDKVAECKQKLAELDQTPK